MTREELLAIPDWSADFEMEDHLMETATETTQEVLQSIVAKTLETEAPADLKPESQSLLKTLKKSICLGQLAIGETPLTAFSGWPLDTELYGSILQSIKGAPVELLRKEERLQDLFMVALENRQALAFTAKELGAVKGQMEEFAQGIIQKDEKLKKLQGKLFTIYNLSPTPINTRSVVGNCSYFGNCSYQKHRYFGAKYVGHMDPSLGGPIVVTCRVN
jgi:hypothetical protein